MGANMTLNCTGYTLLTWSVSTFFTFSFHYSDQLGKTLTYRNKSANAVVRYTLKGSNKLMTLTLTMNLSILTSHLAIDCFGNAHPHGHLGWRMNDISVVNDDKSKLH